MRGSLNNFGKRRNVGEADQEPGEELDTGNSPDRATESSMLNMGEAVRFRFPRAGPRSRDVKSTTDPANGPRNAEQTFAIANRRLAGLCSRCQTLGRSYTCAAMRAGTGGDRPDRTLSA